MKKRFLTIMCIGMMALSLVGCDKENKKDKEEKKKPTEVTTDFELPGFGGSDDEEKPEEKPENKPEDEPEDKPENKPDDKEDVTTENNLVSNDWTLVGSDRTGYIELPEGWLEHESEAEDGIKFALQYISPEEDCLVSLIDSDYSFDVNEYDVEDPADIINQAYIEQYSSMGGENEEVRKVTMGGMRFYLTIDVLPEGTYTDYEYVIYTYVAYENDRFYTVCVEGKRDVVEEIAESAEATYTLSENGESYTGIEEDDADDDSSNVTVSGEADWETYYACVDGDEYILPCDFSEFASNGWSVEASGDGELIEYEDYCYAFIEKDNVQMCIVVANKYDESDIPINEGQVVGVVFDYNVDEIMCYIEGGIRLNTTYDEVIEAFGTPDEIYEDDEEDYKKITYYGATYSTDMYTSLDIILEDGVVTQISMIHW